MRDWDSMRARNRALKAARLLHVYLGVFFAPAILFFALTGALQTFSLHEEARGSAYKPPVWIVRLAQLHKKQMLALPARRGPGAAPNGPAAKAAPRSAAPLPSPAASRPNPLPVRIFFLAASLGLCASTLTGIWMAYRYGHSRAAVSLALLAGVAVPVLLLLF